MRVRSYWVTLAFDSLLFIGPSDAERMPNKEIPGIIQELEDLASELNCDAFILYLYPLYSK